MYTLFGLFLFILTGKNWRPHSNFSNFWKGPGAKILYEEIGDCS